MIQFRDEHANESLASHQETADPIGVCCFSMSKKYVIARRA